MMTVGDTVIQISRTLRELLFGRDEREDFLRQVPAPASRPGGVQKRLLFELNRESPNAPDSPLGLGMQRHV